MKILVINGPNLNMLGIREPGIYGKSTYADLCRLLEQTAKDLGMEVEIYQSNHEGDLVDKIQWAYGKIDGIVINPAAYTHTSVAILCKDHQRPRLHRISGGHGLPEGAIFPLTFRTGIWYPKVDSERPR